MNAELRDFIRVAAARQAWRRSGSSVEYRKYYNLRFQYEVDHGVFLHFLGEP